MTNNSKLKKADTNTEVQSTPEKPLQEPNNKPVKFVQEILAGMVAQVQVTAIDKLTSTDLKQLFELSLNNEKEKQQQDINLRKIALIGFLVLFGILAIAILIFSGWCVSYGKPEIVQIVLNTLVGILGGVGLTSIGRSFFKRQD